MGKMNKWEQAFPNIKTEYTEEGEPAGVLSHGGLTKREFMAAMALVGHMAGPNPQFDQVAAARCISAADAVLVELERKQPNEGEQK